MIKYDKILLFRIKLYKIILRKKNVILSWKLEFTARAKSTVLKYKYIYIYIYIYING